MSIPTFNINKSIAEKYNRGTDNKFVESASAPLKIGFYTVDNAILRHLQNNIKPIVTQDNKQIKVPVIYGNPERWKSAQLDGMIRDKNGKILLPLIMIRRTSIQKSSINSPVNKYHRYVFKSTWNSRNIYDRMTAVNKITPSNVYSSIVVPDYYNFTYEVMVWTEYMEQMNDLMEHITFESNEYWGDPNNYRFITTVDEFDQTTELPSNADRLVRAKFNLKVKAYILPQDGLNKNNKKSATSHVEYSPKKVVFSTEIETNSVIDRE